METIKGILGYNRVSIIKNAKDIVIEVVAESHLISAGKALNKLDLKFDLFNNSNSEYPLGWIFYNCEYNTQKVFDLLKEELRTEEEFSQSNIDALPEFFGYAD